MGAKRGRTLIIVETNLQRTSALGRPAPRTSAVSSPQTERLAPMSGETPEEQEPCADVGHDGEEEPPVDGSLALAGFDPELLLQLAETIGNPLVLLVSKAHLSKAFCEAARAAQATLAHIDLRKRRRAVDDAFVAAVVLNCSQLTSLSLGGCGSITDAAVVAVASGCTLLSSLDLDSCCSITDAAVKAVASGCKQLSTQRRAL